MAASHTPHPTHASNSSSFVAEQSTVSPNALVDLFLQHAPVAWSVLDSELTYVLASDSWREAFDLRAETLEGTGHFDVFEEDRILREAILKALDGVSQGGKDHTFRTRAGRDHVVAWKAYPVGSHGEGVVLFIDPGHGPAPEDRRDDVEQFYRIVSEYALDLVCLHASDGRYQYVSPSVRDVLGYTPDELVGRLPGELIHPDDLEGERDDSVRSLFGTEAGETVRYRARHKDGMYRWLETSINFVADEEGEIAYILTNSRDISESVHAKEALRRTNRALEQRNRELEDFAYVASHDLQEPLRKIRAFANLLQEDYEGQLDEMGAYYLDRMHDAATRMSRLISDLLAFSRVTTKARPFQRVDLGDIMRHVISDLEIQISDVEATIDLGTLPVVTADPTQLRQLFQNLISNALKFRRPDVRPVVYVAEASGEQEELPEDADPNDAHIIVRDNGIGFDEKYLDRIFSPFERLHARGEYPGTGMGLAISRRIVERHGGILSARSAPGEGATFVVTLPRTPDDSSQGTETSKE